MHDPLSVISLVINSMLLNLFCMDHFITNLTLKNNFIIPDFIVYRNNPENGL